VFRRKPPLPDDLHSAWWCFVDCAEVIEAGRRQLLATLPAGRVEPAPIGVGLDAMEDAISDAAGWMDGWRCDELEDVWVVCAEALHEAGDSVPEVREVAASPGELDDIIGALQGIVDPLDVFADAETVWRRRWRLPADPDRTADRSADMARPEGYMP
jgi:hypothetical protein